MSQFGGNFKIQNLSEEFPFLILPFDIFWQAGSANFYLPFGRAWELLAGSLTCLFVNKKKIIDKKSNDIFTVIGAILIIISIFTYSSNIQYPSLFTLLPVIGTVLLIVYSTNSTHVCKILSYKPLVFFGLISFSLYLWHQPLLAFSRLYYGVDLSLNCKMLILATTFFFSYLTWRFIETPFRNKKIISDKKVIISILTVALMILLLSLSIYFSKITGFQKPLPSYISKTFESENPKNCFDLPYAHLDKSEWYCEIGEDSKNITFAVFGDSHALSLKQAFDKAGLTQNKKGIFSGLPGCPALLGINSLRSDVNIRNCKLLNKKMYDFVKKNDLKKIFLISRWTYYTVGNINQNNLNLISKEGFFSSNQNSSKSAFIFGLNNTIKNYQNLNVDVYFIHQVPEQFYDPKYVYQKSLDRKQNKVNEKKLSSFAVTFKEHLEHQKFIKDNLKIKSKEFSNLKEIDFDNIFCNNKKCLHGTQKTSYYSDTHHLSKAGSMKTLNAIKKLID